MVEGLVVKPTPAFAFKEGPRDIESAGRQLGADYILDASFTLSKGSLRVNARLVRLADRLVATNPWRAATWMLRPEVAFLRDDPRFAAICRRLGMPD